MKLSTLFATALILTGTAAVANAPYQLRYQKLNEFEYQGDVEMNKVVFTGHVAIHGDVKAKYVTFNTLDVQGNGRLIDAIVVDECVIHGDLDASQVAFTGPVTVHGDSVMLKKSAMHSLNVKGGRGRQIVTLGKGSVITGPVTFEAGNGVVVCSGGTFLGEVNGGTVRSQ